MTCFLAAGLWRKGKVSPEDSAVVERFDRDLVRCQKYKTHLGKDWVCYMFPFQHHLL